MSRNFVKGKTFKIMKAADFKAGDSLEGKYMGTRIRSIQVRNDAGKPTGELQDLKDHKFINDDGTQFCLPEDAGFRVALGEAELKEGEYVQINKLPQIKVGVNNCNQYEILKSE